MSRLRILALIAAAACALVATWTLSRAQSPNAPGVADSTAGGAVAHAPST